jgi:hypothetical protein
MVAHGADLRFDQLVARVKVVGTDVMIAPTAGAVVGRWDGAMLRTTHPAVSRVHARFEWDGAAWTLRDLGSRNGTRLNGIFIAPSHERRLCVGDRIVLGKRLSATPFAPPTFEVVDLDPPPEDAAPVDVPLVDNASGGRTGAADQTGAAQELTEMMNCSIELKPERVGSGVAVDVIRPSGERIRMAPRAHFRLLVALSEARDAAWKTFGAALEVCARPEDLCLRLKIQEKGLNTALARVRHSFESLGIEGGRDVIFRTERGLMLGLANVVVIATSEIIVAPSGRGRGRGRAAKRSAPARSRA